jgi:secondary thiamine-phosphate synthase enzyme
MSVYSSELFLETTERTDMVDITDAVQGRLQESGVENGVVVVFVPGSTGALTTIEYESGVLNDLARAIEALAPEGQPYEHDRRWGDGKGYSHVRAALLKPSLAIPVMEGRMSLGTWQQIVLLDFDNRPRRRRVIVQVIGEG